MPIDLRGLHSTGGTCASSILFRKKRWRIEQDSIETYLGSVERGERSISIDNICRLAHALDARLPRPLNRHGERAGPAQTLKH